MKRLILPTLALTCLLVTTTNAAVHTFNSPDGAFATTNGLNGSLWSDPAIAPVDSLAAARAYIGANAADATFMASTVDYPNGPTNVASTSNTIAAALGVDAASLSPASVGSNSVLNTIVQFTGYLVIDAPITLDFALGSDDGSELIIQGVQVINNDGIHPFSSPLVSVEFTQAGLYEVEILFFESQVTGWGLEFNIGTVGGTVVPNSMLAKGVTDIPEPTTFVVWSLLATLGLSVGWRRHRRK